MTINLKALSYFQCHIGISYIREDRRWWNDWDHVLLPALQGWEQKCLHITDTIYKNHRIRESLGFEKTFIIIKSYHQPDLLSPTPKPCLSLPYPHSQKPPGVGNPSLPWAAHSKAWWPSPWRNYSLCPVQMPLNAWCMPYFHPFDADSHGIMPDRYMTEWNKPLIRTEFLHQEIAVLYCSTSDQGCTSIITFKLCIRNQIISLIWLPAQVTVMIIQ